jgi:hypothetical protein
MYKIIHIVTCNVVRNSECIDAREFTAFFFGGLPSQASIYLRALQKRQR